MATITIDIPDPVSDFVATKAAQDGYTSASEFIVDLLRACQQRNTIENKLLEAIRGGDFEEVTPEFWQQMRERAVGKNQSR